MKNLRRIIAIVLACVLSVGMLTTAVFAQDNKADEFKIVTLGDSIGRGYAVTDIGKPCYSKILKGWVDQQVVNENVIVTYKNFATDGWTTPDVLNTLDDEDVVAEIKSATVINISLGGNELIQYLLKEGCIAFDIPFSGDVYENLLNKFNELGTMSALNKVLKRIQSKEMFENLDLVVSKFKKDAIKLLDFIKKENPNAKIIFNTIPRPTHSQLIGDLLDLVIDRRFCKPSENEEAFFAQQTFNKAILEKFGTTDQYNLEIVDSFQYFYENASDENPLTGMKIDFKKLENSTYDPHPNVKGHEEIAKLNIPIYEKIVKSFLDDLKSFGDVDGDSKINTADSLMILKYCAQMEELTPQQIKYADYNKDGIVNTLDSLDILKMIVGLN